MDRNNSTQGPRAIGPHLTISSSPYPSPPLPDLVILENEEQ